MKAFLALVVAGLLLIACDKDKFETKPRIEIQSANPDVINIGDRLDVSLQFFDKEGDVDDSLYIIRRRLNRRASATNNPLTIKFGIPKFPDKTQGEMTMSLEYARHLTVGNTTIPLSGNRREADTLQLRFFVKDAAGNISDTVTLDKNIVVIRYVLKRVKEPPLARFTNFILFTSLFLALCAAGMVYMVYLLFNVAPQWAYLGFTFFGTLCSYNFHWYLTPHSFSGSYKAAWSVRNKKLHLFLLSSGIIGALYFGWQLLPHWGWLLGTAVLTFFYSAPMIPHPAARLLQRIAIGKTLFLSFAWTHVTAVLPLVLQQNQLTHAQMLYVINRFFLIYAICIVFDYRDREGDLRNGIRSVVTSFEPAGVHRFFWGVLIAFFLSCGLLPLFHFSLSATVALALPGIAMALLFEYSLRHPADYLFYGGLDGLMALSLPLLLLFQLLGSIFL